MELIEHYEVPSGGVAVIELDLIPQTYTDLLLVTSLRTDETPNYQDAILRFNGTIVTQRALFANSTSPSSFSVTTDNFFSHNGGASTASTFSNASLYIPNYALTTQNKSASSDIVVENNSGSSGSFLLSISAWLYTSNNAVETISLTARTSGKVFVQGSSVSLYGILAGSDGIVSVS
jgi:hypothetical protein